MVSVEFNNRHSYFGAYAFKDCIGLRKIQIPPKTYLVPEGTFYGCSALTSIEFPEYEPHLVSFLGDNFLSGCNRLTSLVLPKSINSLTCFSEKAFNGSSLRRLKLNGLSMADISLNFHGEEQTKEIDTRKTGEILVASSFDQVKQLVVASMEKGIPIGLLRT